MLALILEHRFAIQFSAMLVITLLAIWKGGGPERVAGAIFLAMYLSDRLYHLVFGKAINLGTVDLYHAGADLVVAAALIALALRANRMYPLCLAGLQVIAFSAHLTREMIPGMTPIAYATLFILPSYVQLPTLALGLRAHRQRLRRFGPYRDWRISSASVPTAG